VEVWQCGSVEVWQCGSVEVWHCGSVEVWQKISDRHARTPCVILL